MKRKIEIRESHIKGAGRGVFATGNIKKGEIIEICPLLIFSGEEYVHLGNTLLQHYVYDYDGIGAMLALGYGSMYNHVHNPNARYELAEYPGRPGQSAELYIIAQRPILKDEEICINYGFEYDVMYTPKK